MHYGMDQPISHAYGGHSGTVTADSGYQSAGSSALYTPCTVCGTAAAFFPTYSTRPNRSATPTLNTSTRTLGKCGPTVLMFARLLPIPNHSELFVRYVPSSSHRLAYLKSLSIHRSVRSTLNMLIRTLERHMPIAPRNARQLKLQVDKHNTHSHNKIPYLYPPSYLLLGLWIS